ncbi:MAG TPA: hypothetical protein VLB74_01720 [Flavobacterium sp.]|uniref:energy transducer TonB n=1 Tax=Flavobacterium sp. TaxID=239 RepID=UPI002B9C8757|nr:hypothetical protein [Flavobacterium sp.]HSD13346.1 hypothetical protein [Flavobacterium sp.]
MKRILILFVFNLFGHYSYSQSSNAVPIEEDNRVYVAVEHNAVPQGGIQQFYSDFVKEYKSPELPAGTEELRLLISFVVEKDGSLTELKVLRDGGVASAAVEAVRVLKSLPNWESAFQNGQKVRSQFTLPITLKGNTRKKQFRDYLNK